MCCELLNPISFTLKWEAVIPLMDNKVVKNSLYGEMHDDKK